MSSATSATSCSRLDGFVADLIVAIDSFAASMGPPGSASAMARPATNGARTIRVHSSSEKSFLVVTTCPFVRGRWLACASVGSHPHLSLHGRAGPCHGLDMPMSECQQLNERFGDVETHRA